MKSKWYGLAAGACLLQGASCIDMGNETLVRIAWDFLFLPINNAIISVFQIV